MSIRLINTSREVIEFPTVQEAYDFVLSLDPPMAFRTDAPEPVCIPIDPESSPSQLSLRTYAILRMCFFNVTPHVILLFVEDSCYAIGY